MKLLKRPRDFSLGENVFLSFWFHYASMEVICLILIIYPPPPPSRDPQTDYPRNQHRMLVGKTVREVVQKARLALARGTENIHWDEKVMARLNGGKK